MAPFEAVAMEFQDSRVTQAKLESSNVDLSLESSTGASHGRQGGPHHPPGGEVAAESWDIYVYV